MVALCFKLVQTNSRLNQLFKASMCALMSDKPQSSIQFDLAFTVSSASLPSIGNLFLLWATIFIFFAIMFVEVRLDRAIDY
jgi:hypothetical protein